MRRVPIIKLTDIGGDKNKTFALIRRDNLQLCVSNLVPRAFSPAWGRTLGTRLMCFHNSAVLKLFKSTNPCYAYSRALFNMTLKQGHTWDVIIITLQYAMAKHTCCDSVNQRKSPKLSIPVREIMFTAKVRIYLRKTLRRENLLSPDAL